MTAEDEIELLETILTHTVSMIDIDENGTAIERRHLVQRIDKLKIEIYPLEHPPPHFHVKSTTTDVTFAITDCELLKGNIDSKTLKKIRHFHSANKTKLISIWNRLRPTDCPVGPIIN